MDFYDKLNNAVTASNSIKQSQLLEEQNRLLREQNELKKKENELKRKELEQQAAALNSNTNSSTTSQSGLARPSSTSVDIILLL